MLEALVESFNCSSCTETEQAQLNWIVVRAGIWLILCSILIFLGFVCWTRSTTLFNQYDREYKAWREEGMKTTAPCRDEAEFLAAVAFLLFGAPTIMVVIQLFLIARVLTAPHLAL